MPFIMEYVPSHDRNSQIEHIRKKLENHGPSTLPITFEKFLESEYRLSDFVISAREKLRVGHSYYDSWAINHEEAMALVHKGYPRRELDEEPDVCFWEFMLEARIYHICTKKMLCSEFSPGVLVATYSIRSIRCGDELINNKLLLDFIKEAIFEHAKYSIFDFNRYPIRHVNFQGA